MNSRSDGGFWVFLFLGWSGSGSLTCDGCLSDCLSIVPLPGFVVAHCFDAV